MPANAEDLRRGTWRLEVDDEGNEVQVEDHSRRPTHPPKERR